MDGDLNSKKTKKQIISGLVPTEEGVKDEMTLMWNLNLDSDRVFLHFIFSKGEKTGHHESCTLHYMNVCGVFREKLCIIHSMRLLKRLWLKSVMVFSKKCNFECNCKWWKGKGKKIKEKEQLQIFLKKKHNRSALLSFLFIFSGAQGQE